MAVQQLYANGKLLDLRTAGSSPLSEDFHELLEFGILASKRDAFDPMERALLQTGTEYLRGTEHLHADWNLEREYPLSAELPSITQAWKPRNGRECVVGTKGAPESIIDLCHMDKASADSARQILSEMATRGLRVLGVAKAHAQQFPLPASQHGFGFKFLGFLGLADPIRPGVPEAVAECLTAGIRVVMLTGDHPITARTIARTIGLANPDQVLTGSELDQMSPETLKEAVKTISVFSRVIPRQKLRLVQALRENGEIVAMTGDGVNDVPALKAADIGIAMGARGTDVAREAAVLVLLDDDFGSIVEAIRMGRRVYVNLQRAIIYLVAIHVPIAAISILPVFLNLPLVLLPIHIAFLHLLIEPASSVVFEAEPAGPRIMHQPPRKAKESLFGKNVFRPSLIQGASIFAALLVVYLVSLILKQSEREARTLSFSVLIIANLALILLKPYANEIIPLQTRYKQNRALIVVLLGSGILLLAALYLPFLRETFKFAPIHLHDIVICAITGVFSVAILKYPRKLIRT